MLEAIAAKKQKGGTIDWFRPFLMSFLRIAIRKTHN